MLSININGIVQGVGFRPFVYKLASINNLKGYVRNSSQGVDIKVTGSQKSLKIFVEQLKKDAPMAAKIDTMIVTTYPDRNFKAFIIMNSQSTSGSTFIAPDLATCPECLSELLNISDQRFNYPFINCTNCGPRYSIIDSLPYDRPATSMRSFEMCDYCHQEYCEPLNRRFHAQPVACSQCGPQLQLLDENQNPVPGDPLYVTRKFLKEGKIIAIKGIGGFHLACLATDNDPVSVLRSRKQRPHKPFAVMCQAKDLESIVHLNDSARQLLHSPAAPIVILPATGRHISLLVAPDNPFLGVFLPYTPLHHLLLQENIKFLIMTSANPHNEPVAAIAAELPNYYDYILTHNRAILNRCDDSVIRSTSSHNIFIRRSRGYVPIPVKSIIPLKETFAAGAEMKLTFALASENSIFLSPYISNSDTLRSRHFYQETLARYQKWFKISPQLAACDLQPDFMSTRFAESLNIPLIRVQHHHAHIAAVMVEHQINEPVIGIAYDGTGLGDDGNIWGSEIMVVDYKSYQRRFHLEPLPLPGGDAATLHPPRIAYAWLKNLDLDTSLVPDISDWAKRILDIQLQTGLNVFMTSSLGRMFDCLSALLGLAPNITYEAQAAMALEFLCSDDTSLKCQPYDYSICRQNLQIKPLLENVIRDLYNNVPHHIISTRFHHTIIDFTLQAVIQLRQETSINSVALAGGVMQNAIILNNLSRLLKKNNFTVFSAQTISPNDSSIALGQVMIANQQI
ncbi:MAG: carbamoyltransferase HypF [Candidatus Cloacimonetes bacterium]|nr:carbamoyltransferase HypF [Candidatus Cloacimonadota bacterium]